MDCRASSARSPRLGPLERAPEASSILTGAVAKQEEARAWLRPSREIVERLVAAGISHLVFQHRDADLIGSSA
jgi:hypothetical protein